MRLTRTLAIWLMVAFLAVSAHAIEPMAPLAPVDPPGESIVVCGEKIPIGTPVILWSDPGGHNAYELRQAAAGAKPAEPGYRARGKGFSPAQRAEIDKNGMTLPVLQGVVDQFVIHYDVCGTSQRCFDVLQNRGLAVQFMLDLDGTLYQTLDLKEAAYHATKANDRSIGIEIANMGAYPRAELEPAHLERWYKRVDGQTEIQFPDGATVPTLASGSKPLRPSLPEPVVGTIQGQELAMYDLTPEQYAALNKLTSGLCATFPKIRRDVPRDGNGQVLNHKLDDPAYLTYNGILGHFHVQANKTDPGPAFQWDRILTPTPAKPR